MNGGPFGAVIIDQEGNVVSEGVNCVTSSFDPSAHAEVNAIREACKKLRNISLENCILYSSCEPCPMCYGAIHWSRISKVIYAASRDDAALIGFRD